MRGRFATTRRCERGKAEGAVRSDLEINNKNTVNNNNVKKKEKTVINSEVYLVFKLLEDLSKSETNELIFGT